MEMVDMKELDCVEVIVEKENYVREGVHKGMHGWICYNECSFGYWLVNFPQFCAKKDIATISIKEADLQIISKMDARVNEQIKAQHDRDKTTDNISDYLV